MILVDTSVWIDHLHTTEPALTDALLRDEVTCHPLVIEELALGRLQDRDEVLTSLGRLASSPVLGHDELLALAAAHALWGKGLSSVDAHLIGSLLLSPGTQLWTRDKGLRTSAAHLGISTVGWA